MADSTAPVSPPSPLAAELTRRMKAAGLTQKALALKAGLNETAVRDIRRGRSKHPRHDTIEKLATALGCSVMALLAPGTADAMIPPAPSAPARGDSGRAGPTDLPDAAPGGAVGKSGPSEVASLPLFDGAVRAPYPLDATKARVRWPVSRLLVDEIAGGDASRLVAVVVRGNAMAPTLRDGDIAIVDVKSRSVTRDGLYVLHHAGGLVARRLTIAADEGSVAVTCDNESFAAPETTAAAGLAITGRIVWLGHRV